MKFCNRIGNLSLSFGAVIAHILVLQLGLSLLGMTIISFVAGLQGVNLAETGQFMEVVQQAYLKQAPILLVGVHTMTLAIYGMWMIWIEGKEEKRRKWGLLYAPVYPVAVGLVILMGIGMSLFSNGFGVTAGFILPDAVKAFEEAMKAAGMGEEVSVFSALAAVVLAPIGEELLCRGVAYHYAKKAFFGMKNEKLSFWLANGVQAFLFGLFHLVLIQAIYAFVLGLVLGWIREHYKSVYPCMLAHFVVNLFAMTGAAALGLISGIETLTGGVLLMLVGIAVFWSMGLVIAGKDRARIAL